MTDTASRLWRACDHPERPPDWAIVWCDTECSACAIKLGVQLNQCDPIDPDHQQAIRVLHYLLGRLSPEMAGYGGVSDG